MDTLLAQTRFNRCVSIFKFQSGGCFRNRSARSNYRNPDKRLCIAQLQFVNVYIASIQLIGNFTLWQ